MSKLEQSDPQTYAIWGLLLKSITNWAGGFSRRFTRRRRWSSFEARKIPFTREPALPIRYKGIALPCYYRADFVCYGEVIVEFKALDRLTTVELSGDQLSQSHRLAPWFDHQFRREQLAAPPRRVGLTLTILLSKKNL